MWSCRHFLYCYICDISYYDKVMFIIYLDTATVENTLGSAYTLSLSLPPLIPPTCLKWNSICIVERINWDYIMLMWYEFQEGCCLVVLYKNLFVIIYKTYRLRVNLKIQSNVRPWYALNYIYIYECSDDI